MPIKSTLCCGKSAFKAPGARRYSYLLPPPWINWKSVTLHSRHGSRITIVVITGQLNTDRWEHKGEPGNVSHGSHTFCICLVAGDVQSAKRQIKHLGLTVQEFPCTTRNRNNLVMRDEKCAIPQEDGTAGVGFDLLLQPHHF